MKKNITAEDVRLRLNYDPATGIFTWKMRTFVKKGSGKWNDIYAGKEAGSVFKNGYKVIGFGRGANKHYAHRLAWLYMTGEWPKYQIDHIDVDKLNNKWSNLREAALGDNWGNQKIRRNNTSGYKGVSFAHREGKFVASITIDRRHINLGYFDCAEQASKAYIKAAKKRYGEFMRAE